MTRSDLSSAQASHRQQRPPLTAVPLKALAWVVGIPLMVMGLTYLSVRQGAVDLSRDTAQRLREEGNLINRRIQEQVEALSGQNRQLTLDPRVIAAVTPVAEGTEAPPAALDNLDNWGSAGGLTGDLDLVALMEAQTQQRVIEDPLLDANDELGRALGQVLLDTERQGLTWVGDDWLLYAAAPVRSPDQGVIGGLLIAQRLKDAQANAFNFDRADLILALHSPTGAVAAHSQPLDPGRFDLDSWRRAASGQVIIENGILFRSFRLGMSEGLVFSLSDPTLAPRQQAILRRALIYSLGLGLVALLVSVLIARLWANQTRQGDLPPSASLQSEGSGQTAIRLAKMSAAGQDEVGRLFHSFEIMAHQLQITLETLEDKVAERTAQLASARLQAEEARSAAEAANQSKSQFLANMSHELRTPMNAIIGYTEILMEEAEEEDLDSFGPDLKKIHAAAKHLLALINDVLDLSKIEAGKMDLYLETFELDPLVEEVISTIQPLADKNSNRLVIKRTQALGSIHGDMTKLRQNLFNLLSNACKFTHAGEVSLEIARRQTQGREWIFFRVRDSGIGMTPEQMGRLFQAFSQADQATTRKYGGTGLGLVITRRFCQMMGGDIKVESEPGQGSTFTFWIPAQIEATVKEHTLKAEADKAAQVDGSQAPEKLIGSAGRRTGSGPRPLVLVIDDDATVCDLIERALQKQGYQVAIAQSGSEGIEMARRLHPAVITLDVMMPQMDGWTVLSTLKADPGVARIPVVMVTIVDEKNLGFALGATEYLTKPFDRERLVEVIGRYCPAQRVPTALIIDDDQANRHLLRRVLEKEGWQVQEAANGRPALHILNNVQPDLILLDLMMPEMDGFEFAVRLRQNTQWRDIPVVVLTAKTLTPADRQRLKGSVEAILGKSALSREALVAEIQQLVQSRAVGSNR